MSAESDENTAVLRFLNQIEVNQTLTALYLLVEVSRWQLSKQDDISMRETIGVYYSPLWPDISLR